MNYVVFALGFKMSSVYISKNCLAVVRYERPFFSFSPINQDVLVGCKPLLTGCPRGGGRWGDRRHPREGQAVTSVVRKCRPSWQGEAPACRPSHTPAASHFVTESPFGKPGRTSCLPGCGTASAGPAGRMPQLSARCPAGQAALRCNIALQWSTCFFCMMLACAPS